MGGGSGRPRGVLGVAKGGGVAKDDDDRTWRGGWPTPREGGVTKEASGPVAVGLGGVCGIVSDDQGKEVEGVRGDISLSRCGEGEWQESESGGQEEGRWRQVGEEGGVEYGTRLGSVGDLSLPLRVSSDNGQRDCGIGLGLGIGRMATPNTLHGAESAPRQIARGEGGQGRGTSRLEHGAMRGVRRWRRHMAG